MSDSTYPQTLILVIDDDPTIHLWAKRHLTAAGFQLVSALNGLEGVKAFKEHKPDIVLVDLEMPMMDGFTTCTQLRGLAACQNIPLLMVTGSEEPEKIEAAFLSGATDFVVKPINWAILIQRLHYMVKAGQILHKLKASESRLSTTQKMARLGYWEWNSHEDKMYWSDEIYTIFRQTNAAFIPDLHSFLDLIHGDDRDYVQKNLTRAIDSHIANTIEYRIKSSDDRQYFVKQQLDIAYSPQGQALGLSGTIQDITEHKEYQNQVKYLTYYDEVTQLPNRTYFSELLSKALDLAKRHQHIFAVLFLDLDGFKDVNDSYGHHTGDLLLKEIADRIKEGLRHSDVAARFIDPKDYHTDIARLGGDEFTILLNKLSRAEDAAIIAQHIQHCLAEPVLIAGQPIYSSASIGITVYPHDGFDAETLLMNADIAMYHAKKISKGHYRFFHDSMNRIVKKRQEIETLMHQAVQNNELRLFYQPVVNAVSGQLLGVEALMRWESPQLGFLAPNDFIPLAEESGMIVNFGEWALREVCRQHSQWRQQGMGHLTIAVNLSGIQFNHPAFTAMVKDIIEEYQIDPGLLMFELTESILMADTDKILLALLDLKALGIKLSIDDFGTGYSSLSYLKRFPLDSLKIDQSFVKDLTTDADDKAIVEAIMALAGALNLHTVAEGVETFQQWDFLKSHGCDSIQGFFFGKPMPLDEFQRYRLSQPDIKSPRPKPSLHKLS